MPDKFTSDISKLDIENIKTLKSLGNVDQFNIFEKIYSSFVELYFITDEEIVEHYRYSELDTGGIIIRSVLTILETPSLLFRLIKN